MTHQLIPREVNLVSPLCGKCETPAARPAKTPSQTSFVQVVWRIVRILSWILTVILGIVTIRTFLRGQCRPKLERRPRRPKSPADCQPVPSTIYRRPDPLIYDQYYLMGLGLPVTWDNPDIHIELGGAKVDPHTLLPGTEYTVVARVWNGSALSPVVGMPVRFSYLSFGVGMQSHPIGTTSIDLGVKGSALCPAFAQHKWTTPATSGHYCVQVELVWFDDANPLNNLGQTNVDVKPLNSPRATFRFPVRNGGRRAQAVRLQADGYALPGAQPCREKPAPTADMTGDERDRRVRDAIARHAAGRNELPPGWQLHLEPAEFALKPGEMQEIVVEALAPEGFEGRMGFNVNAFDGAVLLGGVTLYAEGAATHTKGRREN